MSENKLNYLKVLRALKEIPFGVGRKLLIDFLNEALSLSQIHKEAYMVVRFSSFSETELEGELEGKPAVFGEDIKAVTYHGAEIIKSNSGDYEIIILFDI